MYDYSIQGILDQIASYSTFGIIYLVGAGLLFGLVAGFYWGIRKAIVVGAIIVAIFFLYLSFQEVGLTIAIISNLLTFFRGILYTMVGLILGAVLSHLMFDVNR